MSRCEAQVTEEILGLGLAGVQGLSNIRALPLSIGIGLLGSGEGGMYELNISDL